MEDEKKIDTEETKEIMAENDESIKIANDVVASIAGAAVSEVPGVYGMAGGITEIFGKKGLTKGIKVEVGEKETKIDVNVIVEYGVRIPDMAFEIQNRVKKAVETMTGLNVTSVNIHIQGINIPEKRGTETEEKDITEQTNEQ